MVNTILNFEWTGLMGLLLYWLPLAVCAVGYIIRTWRNVQEDLKAREAYMAWHADNPEPPPTPSYSDEHFKWRAARPHYEPTDTLGTLIARGLASVIPVCNLLCAACDILPKSLSVFFKTIGAIFDQPLVPKK